MPFPKSNVAGLPSVYAIAWDDCRRLMDAVLDCAIFMLDAEGDIRSWSAGAAQITGYRGDAILGRHFSMLYGSPEVESGKPDRLLAEAIERGRVEDETWLQRSDGGRFRAGVVAISLRAEGEQGGDLRGFGVLMRDLGARRDPEELSRRLLREQAAREGAETTERRLMESEERCRVLSARLAIVLESVADGITVQDRSGRIVFANSAAAKLCGVSSPRELVGTSPAEVVSRFEVLDESGQPFDLEHLPGRRVLAGEDTSSALLRVKERRGRGREWWSFVRARAVRDAAGSPELAVNIWHDVTHEQRETQRAKYLANAAAVLGGSLDQDEMLSELAGLLVPELGDWCSIDLLDGDRLRDVTVRPADPAASAAAEKYHRFLSDPAHPRGVWQVIRSGVVEVVNDIDADAPSQTPRDRQAVPLLRSLGMKAALIAPIRVRERALGAIALVSGQSQRRYDSDDVALLSELGRRAGVALENAQLYLAAQDAAQRAEEANRVKDEFLATVSHELRTPLTAILGWSSLLTNRVTDPALVRPLEVIHRNACAQVRIVDDILDVSRIITGKLRLDSKPADLVVIAREAIEVIRPSADAKELQIEFRPQMEACTLLADPDRLQQVIWNLLSNAVKFTHHRGRVRVDLRQEGSEVALSVSDTGIGIDTEFAAHLFQRFRQADSTTTRRVGGLGLGLAIVRHIVELHGGRVSAKSAGLGRGATFEIRLPATASAAPRAEVAAPRRQRRGGSGGAGARLRGVRVLVVDDDLDARELIAAVLAEAGAAVETAPSAPDGFAALARFHPDVLVSDLGMPEEDGLSFMRRVRASSLEDGRGVPSLALTAFARDEDRASALRAGYTAHLGKPVDPGALVAAVADLATSRDR